MTRMEATIEPKGQFKVSSRLHCPGFQTNEEHGMLEYV